MSLYLLWDYQERRYGKGAIEVGCLLLIPPSNMYIVGLAWLTLSSLGLV